MFLVHLGLMRLKLHLKVTLQLMDLHLIIPHSAVVHRWSLIDYHSKNRHPRTQD